MVTSVIWGIFLGFKSVELDITFLAYKTYIIKMYADEYKDGKFKPETIEEKAERELREYEEQVKKKESETITPTIVPDDVMMLPNK